MNCLSPRHRAASVFIYAVLGLCCCIASASAANLRISEVQSSQVPSPNLPTADWWELTSFESVPVDLSGWRFNDNSGGLVDPFTIPAGLVIKPGETIIFVEGLTPTQFRTWWGGPTLRSGFQIITYSGAGLSFGASGDGIRLWDNLTADANAWVDRVDFGQAVPGSTFVLDPVSMTFGAVSQAGVNGAYMAAGTTDVGSPGLVRSSPVLTATLVGDQIQIRFIAHAGFRYSLETASDIAPGGWLETGEWLRADADGPVQFERPRPNQVQFFRVSAQ